jgi:hypothetical protein
MAKKKAPGGVNVFPPVVRGPYHKPFAGAEEGQADPT